MGSIGKLEGLLTSLMERDVDSSSCFVDVDHVVSAVDFVYIITHVDAQLQVLGENLAVVLLLELVALEGITVDEGTDLDSVTHFLCRDGLLCFDTHRYCHHDNN